MTYSKTWNLRMLKSLNCIVFRKEILSQFHTNCRSKYKVKTENEKETSQSTSNTRKHCYKTMYNWKTQHDLAKELANNVIYNNDGIICLNKPYGVRIHSLTEKMITERKTIVQTLHASAAEDVPFSLQGCREELSNILGYKNLILTKTTERYTSGVVFYADSELKKKKINKAFVRSKDLKTPPFKYLAVIVGYPPAPSCEERVGITLTPVKEQRDELLPIIVDTFSKKQMLNQVVKPAHIHYKLLGTNEMKSASLLEISTTCRKWHFLQVYSAHKGMPIIGDNLYGSRVQWVMGKPININIAIAGSLQMTYPSSILHYLELTEKDRSIIPLHLHLHEVKLTIKKKDFVVTAPVPEYFQWTLSKLGLNHCI